MFVFSVFDVKSGTFGTPFFCVNPAVALRTFQDLVNDSQSVVNRYPDDFQLFQFGQFDESTGLFDLSDRPVFLSNARDYLRSLTPMS